MATEQWLRDVPVRADGYLAGKEALAVGGKRPKNLFEALKLQSPLGKMLDALAERVGTPTRSDCPNFSIPALIQTNGETNSYYKKFFIHPLAFQAIAVHWFSPELAADVNYFYYRYKTGDRSLLSEVANKVDEVHGTKSLLTFTSVDLAHKLFQACFD
jgi:hypothetical protein